MFQKNNTNGKHIEDRVSKAKNVLEKTWYGEEKIF